MSKILHILFFIFLMGCNISEQKFINSFDKIPVVIDTLKFNNKILVREQMSVAYHTFSYIGEIMDTIYADHNFLEKNYKRYCKSDREFLEADPNKVKIVIDTSHLVSCFDISDHEHVSILKAFPFFITNLSDKTITIGYGSFLNVVLEARDENLNWKSIEQPYIYRCGIGLSDIILPPNEVAVSSNPIDSGGFKTKLRLRFGNNVVSNEITGYINIFRFKNLLERRSFY